MATWAEAAADWLRGQGLAPADAGSRGRMLAAGVHGLLYDMVLTGQRQEATAAFETLLDACDNLLGRSFCALGDGATSPVTSSIKFFEQDYLDYIEGRKEPMFAKGELAGAH